MPEASVDTIECADHAFHMTVFRDAPDNRIDAALEHAASLPRGTFVSLDPDRIRAATVNVAPGPMAGWTVSLKDLIDEEEIATTAASRLLADAPPAQCDAVIVTRLKAAGAVPFGRTGMTEFAYSGVGLNPHHGTPPNALDPSRVPGGSSSGAAISVARRACRVGIGTDTGGSVRIPAAANGLVGIKPSASLVPLDGVRPLSPSFDSIGPIAASLVDAATALQVMAGVGLPHAPVERPVIGLPQGAFTDGLDEPTRAAWERLTGIVAEAGFSTRTVPMRNLAEALPLARTIIASDAFATYGPHMDALAQIGDPHVCARIAHGGTLDARTVRAAHEERRDVIARFASALDGIDALLAPTIAIRPATIAEAEAEFDRVNAAMLRNTTMINLADGCAVTLPFTVPGYGMPGAAMLCAPHGADDRMLAVAATFERMFTDLAAAA